MFAERGKKRDDVFGDGIPLTVAVIFVDSLLDVTGGGVKCEDWEEWKQICEEQEKWVRVPSEG